MGKNRKHEGLQKRSHELLLLRAWNHPKDYIVLMHYLLDFAPPRTYEKHFLSLFNLDYTSSYLRYVPLTCKKRRG